MKADQINIRDPFILCHDGMYYLYGTDSATTWQGRPEGFNCWTSRDLSEWRGPFRIFTPDASFFSDRHYWAPECFHYEGRFFLISTFGAPDRKKGVYILTADSPLGPFRPHSDNPLTPPGWACIDGTVFKNTDERLYLIF